MKEKKQESKKTRKKNQDRQTIALNGNPARANESKLNHHVVSHTSGLMSEGEALSIIRSLRRSREFISKLVMCFWQTACQ